MTRWLVKILTVIRCFYWIDTMDYWRDRHFLNLWIELWIWLAIVWSQFSAYNVCTVIRKFVFSVPQNRQEVVCSSNLSNCKSMKLSAKLLRNILPESSLSILYLCIYKFTHGILTKIPFDSLEGRQKYTSHSGEYNLWERGNR